MLANHSQVGGTQRAEPGGGLPPASGLQARGPALTLQTALGFALTGFSIDLATRVSADSGWGPGFALLAVGPAAGIVCMALLAGDRRAAQRDAAKSTG